MRHVDGSWVEMEEFFPTVDECGEWAEEKAEEFGATNIKNPTIKPASY